MLSVGTEFRKGIFFVRLKGDLNKNTIYKLNEKVTNIVRENGILFQMEKWEKKVSDLFGKSSWIGEEN